VVRVSAAAIGGDTLTGGSGTNTLSLTTAGTFSLGGVSKFGTINLAAGNSTVTVTDKTLSGGSITLKDGASGNNSVSATGDTAASKGKTLNYTAGTGTDSFTGGFENDVVRVSAASVGGDTLTGGSGTNTLMLTTAGSANLGGVSKFATITLAAGNSTVTVTDKTLSGGAVTIIDGASGANSVSAAGDTAASKGKTLNYTAGSGKDSFTGGFENDKVTVAAIAVGGDTLTGGSGTNTLTLTSAGSANLGGVSKFATINLAAGNSTVTVTDKTLSGGTVTINDAASGSSTITAAGDTAASTGKTLVYNAGAGVDHFTGGFENDQVHVAAASVGGDVLTGGSGVNTLFLTSAGTFSLGGVSKFATINLAAGNNTVTVGDKTLTASVTVKDGASGNNSISAAGDTAASKGKTLSYSAGSGVDHFTGGFENDKITVSTAAVGGDTLTGGSGTNTLTLTGAGSANLGGVSKFGTIVLAAGNNTVTVTDKTLSGGTVTINDGASGNNSVSAAGDTAASKGKTLNYTTGAGTDSFTGGFENDVVRVSAASVGGDTLTGGTGTNTLTLASAGSANLGGVSKFATINLAVGNSTVTVTDKTLSGGAVTINDGASGNNSVSAAGDTAASTGKTLTYVARTGTDSFTGGFENDKISVAAASVGGDTLTGGSGTNTLTLTTAGIANLGGVSKFATINLAAGNSTVTVTDTTLSGGSVTISDGASGNNSVSAAGDTAASKGKTLTYIARAGTDHFTGGFENDKVTVSAASVGGDTLTGGSGANTLVLTTAGAVNLGGVSNFATINLATGNNTVTVTDTTLSGGSVAVHGGASGNNSISAAGDTAASAGKTLTDFLGTGTDTFTGGFEDDTIITVNVALNVGDSINGGSGNNTLMLTGGGLFNLGGVKALTNIQTVDAAEGQAAGGGVPNSVQTVNLRAGLDLTVNVASGTPNPLDPNPETITINGAANNDVINLGNGTDTVVIGGTGETVNAGNGTALVSATAAFAGALVNGGSGTTNLKITTGGTATLNASDSKLTVNLTSATNLTLSKMSFITAVGSTGNDTISALAQGQTLTGGGGKDTLNGFSGFGDVFSDTSAHLNTTTIGNFGGSDLIDLTDMNPNTIQPLAFNTSTETLTVADGTHTSNVKFIGSYTLSNFQFDGSDGHIGSLIKFV
jgi:hypothetical protein